MLLIVACWCLCMSCRSSQQLQLGHRISLAQAQEFRVPNLARQRCELHACVLGVKHDYFMLYSA